MEFKEITPEMREKLRAKLPDEAVKQHPTKTYLSSIKAIYVVERLNDVFGIGSWRLISEVISVDHGMVVVKSLLQIDAYNVYLEAYGGNDNGGEAGKNFDLGDAYKGAVTDAFTKICSYLEIGIDVFKGKHTGKSNDNSHSGTNGQPEGDRPRYVFGYYKNENLEELTREKVDGFLKWIADNKEKPKAIEKFVAGLSKFRCKKDWQTEILNALEVKQ